MADLTDADILEWLKSDEEESRASRIRRIGKLLRIMPLPEDGFGLHDGETAQFLFNEIRLCYVNGLYIATVLSALAFLEREIAAKLHAAGWNDASKATFEALLIEAVDRGIIAASERETINDLRKLRNSFAHYRGPLHITSIISRAIDREMDFAEMLESDADKAVAMVARFINSRFG